MSSSTCCTSRHPPSPDGPAPRPVPTSPPTLKLHRTPPQEYFALSWSTGSRLSKPEDVADMQAIFEEDKPSPANSEREKAKIRAKKSSSTLKAVKNRLKKRLSRGSSLSKRHSRSSVGTSEEEVERRAELRRIRHKRIQEELSNEGIYDEDAKSLFSLGGGGTPDAELGKKKRASSAAPGMRLSMPSLTPPALLLPVLTLPSLALPMIQEKGPDEGFYNWLTFPEATPRPRSEPDFTELSNTIVNSSSNRSRRYSSPGPSSPDFEPSVYSPKRKRSSIPPLPAAPILLPKRLPSIPEPTKSSWRLSFSSDNRAEQLRKLSQGSKIPLPVDTGRQIESLQPINRWLHSQGLRSTSQIVENSERIPNLESLASHSGTCTAGQDFGGVDGVGDLTGAIHLHEMGISRRLASKGLMSSSSSPQLSSLGSRYHNRSSGNSRTTNHSRARYLRTTSESIPLSERVPESWGNVLQDGTSSFYPSGGNSIQPSPQSSRFNLFSLLTTSKSKIELIDIKDFEVTETPVSVEPTLIATVSTNSLAIPFSSCHRRPTIDANSIVLSETESFREREAELTMIKTRFASTEARRSTSTPISSKFREEFDFKPLPVDVHTPTKRSAFARLAKLAARSYDGPMERMLGVPLTTPLEPEETRRRHQSTYSKSGPTPVIPANDGNAMGLRGNTMKLHPEPKAKDMTHNLHIPRQKSGLSARKKSHVSHDSRRKKAAALKSLGWGMGDKDSSEESEKEVDVEEDWEAELAKTAQKAQARSRAIVRKADVPDTRFPESWSRYSTHDRKERVSSSGADDGVTVTDFATDGSEFLVVGKKGLRERLKKRLIAEFDKTQTAEVQNNTDTTFGRRSSMRPAGDLEYPELEILPLQTVPLMRSHEEIAEHVEEELQEEEWTKKEEELDAIFGAPKKALEKAELKPSTAKKDVERLEPRLKVIDQDPENVKGIPTLAPKVMTEQAADTPVKKGPVARRGPVARKPGDDASLPKPKQAPKIAPPIIMPATRPALSRAGAGASDGSADFEDADSVIAQAGESEVDELEMSIADPRFYDDCIVTQDGAEDADCEDSDDGLGDEMALKSLRKAKFRTWSGRDWDGFRYEKERRNRSLGTMVLRGIAGGVSYGGESGEGD